MKIMRWPILGFELFARLTFGIFANATDNNKTALWLPKANIISQYLYPLLYLKKEINFIPVGLY